ncbi:MAG: efflux RND transporter periplasmic adaptor subunit [Candidatus Sumerlaeota bacterium]|nr:efflux RND transporter periplasmic adaptor subunit [Candidatus Sumerlaeota bacterium]
MRRAKWFSAVVAGAVLVLGFLAHQALVGRAPAEGESAESAGGEEVETEARVATDVVQRGALPLTMQALGRVVSPRQARASIVALSPGVVTEIPLRAGEEVTSGTVLLKFDARACEAGLAKARAALASAEKELDYAEKSGLDQQQAELNLAAAQARVAADQTRREADQLAQLYAKSLTSEKASREAAQKAATSEQEAASAEKKASLFSKSGRALDLAKLRSSVEQARAEARVAEIESEAATVRSPMPGRVTRLNVTAGQSVEKGVLLAEIEPSGGAAATFDLPPDGAAKIRLGMSFTLTGNGGSRTYSGRIVSVGAGVEPETGLVRIEGVLNSKESKPYLGEVLSGAIITGTSPEGLIVPVSALSTTDDGPALHVVDGEGKAHVTVVEVLARNSTQAVVKAGKLEEGQKIVVDGNYNLPDGSKVVEEGKAEGKAEAQEEGKQGDNEAAADKEQL